MLSKEPFSLINYLSKRTIVLFVGICLWKTAPQGLAQHPEHIHPGEHPVVVHAEPSFAAGLNWDSKYVSEGRDNLNEGGLMSVNLDISTPLETGELFFAGWYADSIDTAYTELNLGIGYGLSFDKFDLAIGYTWLDFSGPSATDNEFSLEMVSSTLGTVDLGAAFVYSTEAGGTFIELIASTEIERERFNLTPYALLGINQGFIPGERKGLNNLQLGIEASTPLSDKVELGGYLAYSIALDEEPGESLDDIFWVGIYLGI